MALKILLGQLAWVSCTVHIPCKKGSVDVVFLFSGCDFLFEIQCQGTLYQGISNICCISNNCWGNRCHMIDEYLAGSGQPSGFVPAALPSEVSFGCKMNEVSKLWVYCQVNQGCVSTVSDKLALLLQSILKTIRKRNWHCSCLVPDKNCWLPN